MVGLKMPRAVEILDATVRRLERGEMTALEAIDALLAEEFTLRENRRVKMALVMFRAWFSSNRNKFEDVCELIQPLFGRMPACGIVPCGPRNHLSRPGDPRSGICLSYRLL